MNDHLLNAAYALRCAAVALGLSAVMSMMRLLSILLPEVRRFRRLHPSRRVRRHDE